MNSGDTKFLQTVLVLCVKDNHLFLARKKRGIGQGKLNSAGGKIEAGENPEQTAVRELNEELGLTAKQEDLQKVAECIFHFKEPAFHIYNHVFLLARWSGAPQETEELAEFAWYPFDHLPLEHMWQDDRLWLSRTLTGERLRAEFWFADDNEAIAKHEITPLQLAIYKTL